MLWFNCGHWLFVLTSVPSHYLQVPLEAPIGVGVELLNSTTVVVTWAAIEIESVRGHLLGYKVLLLLSK